MPVIWGWITVGTQSSPDSITHALRADPARRALEPPIQDDDDDNLLYQESREQHGIVSRSGLTPHPHPPRAQTVVGGFQAPPVANVQVPKWYGADIRGDERLSGPIFNYARVFTWWQFATSIEKALETTAENIESGLNCRGERWKVT